MRRNLPGAFTFILPTSSQLPHIYKNRKTVGIRVPDNAIARAITRELGNPLMSTSISPQEEFENTADLFVDGGTGGHIPSTIIDCSGETPKITREGKGELIG